MSAARHEAPLGGERRELGDRTIFLPKPYRLPRLFAALQAARFGDREVTDDMPSISEDSASEQRPGQGFDPSRTVYDLDELDLGFGDTGHYDRDSLDDDA